MPSNRKPRNLDSRFEIRLSAADKRTIELKAQEARMSVAAWIRHRLMLDATLAQSTPPVNSTQPTTATPAKQPASVIAQSELWG